MKFITALRSAFFDLLFYGWTLIASLIGYALALIPSRKPLACWALIWIEGIGFFERWILGLRYTLQGKENLPPPPYIVAMQHQSAWETIKLLEWFPDAAIVLKEELLRTPLWGACVKRYGCIPVARSKKLEDLHRFLKSARDMAETKRPIVIFPEGTRRASGAPASYNKGVAVLQEELKLPVIPVTLNSGKFWTRKAFLKYAGRIEVKIHPPIILQQLPYKPLLHELHRLFHEDGKG